jgi:amino acid transporter
MEATDIPVAAPDGSPGLRGNALGRFDSVVMAVAGSAPAYSIAGTSAALVAAVGVASPAALLYCGIPMFGIVFAFGYLTRIDPNAGASYSWVARALHPALGFIAGWALVVSAVIFMVAATLPAGTATISLFTHSTPSTNTVIAVGAVWFLVMLAVVAAGIKLTVHAQWVMSGVEIVILVVVGAIALIRGGHGTHFSWSWFGFGHFGSLTGFAGGALIAAFYYWGWDVTSNLGEETKDSRRNAGAGALIGVGVVFATFIAYSVAVNLVLTPDEVSSNAGNVLGPLGDAVWPGAGGKLLTIAVMLSTVATLETTLIQVTRSLFSMGRDRTVPAAFGRVHPQRQTPLVATAAVGVVALLLFFGSSKVGSVGTIMTEAVTAIGLQICVYYTLAAVAVVVAYRRLVFTSAKNFLFVGLWPALGAVFMAWIFVKALPGLNAQTKEVGLGALGLGVIPLGWYWAKGSDYYRSRGVRGPEAVEPESVGEAVAS